MQLRKDIEEYSKTLPHDISDYITLYSAEFNNNTMEYKARILSFTKYDLLYDSDFYNQFVNNLNSTGSYNLNIEQANLNELLNIIAQEEKKSTIQNFITDANNANFVNILKKVKVVNIHYYFYDTDKELLYDYEIEPKDL
jgi:hypothetical protein